MYSNNYFAPSVNYSNYMYYSLNPNKTNLKDICNTVSKVSSKTYTGKAVTPSFTLTYKNSDGTTSTLKYGTDFTVQYGNRTKLGLGVIRFVGKGAYTGVKEQYFSITPTSKHIKISPLYKNGGTISWATFNGADGYNIYKYNSTTKKYSLIRKDWSLNRYTVSDLKSATVYKYMIKPYYNVKNSRTGTTTAKEFSSLTISFTTRPDYATLKKITKPAKKTAVIYWNKVTRVSGYQVVVAKDYKLKSVVKSYYTTGTSKKITGLTSGKWYYIAVRPYKNFNGKKVYSSNYAYYYTKIK